MKNKQIILIKGAGDVASGIAYVLYKAGYGIIMSELRQPRLLRKTVSFGQALYSGQVKLENIIAREANLENYSEILALGQIPIIPDLQAKDLEKIAPYALLDAILAKKNTGTCKNPNYLTIALGPGFLAPAEVDLVLETKPGADFGKIISHGQALANTSLPAEESGARRLVRAPIQGKLDFTVKIGQKVEAEQRIGFIHGFEGKLELKASLSGIVRGLMENGLEVQAKTKIADLDPSCSYEDCFKISERGLKLGQSLLDFLGCVSK